MRIQDARRSRTETSSRGFRTLGRFSLAAAEGILIFDCRLILAPDGRLLVYGPAGKNDAPVVSLSRENRDQLVTLALAALRIDQNEFQRAA
jgi:hypothetical protein